jgi:hypothetical protein
MLLTTLVGHSQRKFSKVDVDLITSQFSNDLYKYVSYGSYKIYRENFLDSVAEVRTDYFTAVLQETGKKFCLYDLTENISKNSQGHSRYFGNPRLFKEPIGCRYPDPLPLIENKKTKVTAEIMQQTTWTKSSEYQYTDQQLIKMATAAIESNFGKTFIIDGYKESASHRNAIKNYANGAYGTCTKAIISRKRNELEKVWIYEVVIYNLTIFSKPA